MPSDPPRKDLPDTIEDKVERRMKARSRDKHSVWFGLGMFGLVGWSVAVPTILGIAAGVWLDRHLSGKISWTLTLLFLGVALGCLNAWFWIKREIRGNDDIR